ncbi:unnamed protein product [Rotaria sp. Silwood2]|nr:unnamed protein product [Rotaria sp. Silwood2]
MLLDDGNTAFDAERYLRPARILRYYNCQVYDDHIAAHSPKKDNPVCFRCAQHHPYISNCNNVIKCAHCQCDHMAEVKDIKSNDLPLFKGVPQGSSVGTVLLIAFYYDMVKSSIKSPP